MKIRGWVYVLSNKAMPGLVKVGYSTKDPILRIEELNGTGLPHSFVLEYDVLVVEPRDVEQSVHKELSQYHEAKEFFRTSVRTAVSAIKAVLTRSGKNIIAEQFNNKAGADIGNNARRSTNAEDCRVCGSPVKQSDARCPNCFALLM